MPAGAVAQSVFDDEHLFWQAAAYGPKRWVHIIAPTNRRPYGFDWEDFGRMDAMEVLALAKG